MLRRRRQAALVASLLALLLLGGAAAASALTSQPIRYNHNVHVVAYKMDCRFCHSSAMKTASAGIPSVEKCMICHRVIAVDHPEIKKIAQYWKEKKPIPWNRVTELPDYTYFPHFRMVNAGIACLTCHPGMDKVDVAVQEQEFTMGFCLKCHKARGVSIECWSCHI
ncbi:MAG: menaquinol oxidoreductase [Deltaproteobacteria bacterium]|nr:menaquinol oxidoreductase [Deltaproteobacteria bacterium]PWB67144.1 MAG: menaquinol oxidoreductase [Deltaproteobacteria bacterium]